MFKDKHILYIYVCKLNTKPGAVIIKMSKY